MFFFFNNYNYYTPEYLFSFAYTEFTFEIEIIAKILVI